MIDALLNELRSTTPLEAAAVVLGIVYILLILRRSRLGWIFGGVSSAIYVFLSAKARLPMQSVLQFYYVIMAFYGWHTWTRVQQDEDGRIELWPLRSHLIAICAIVAAGVLMAHWLARETHAAWPYLDSITTCTSLLATWLVARMKLENWLYWIAADCVMVFLFAVQGYAFTAGLFLAYMIIAAFGFRTWLHKYQLQNS